MHVCKLLVYSSSVQLGNSFKREIIDALSKDDFYKEIIKEFESEERKEVVKEIRSTEKKMNCRWCMLGINKIV